MQILMWAQETAYLHLTLLQALFEEQADMRPGDKFQARLSQGHKAAITLSRSPAGPASAEKGRGHAGEQHNVII